MSFNSSALPDEAARLEALREIGLLDTEAERDFDEIVALAANICDAPMSLISLVDSERQWFKARKGIDATETPRAQSVCAYTMQNDEVLEISDTRLDARTADNALVDDGVVDMKFYAGAPLVTDDGVQLGALCVLDRTPRELTDLQRQALRVLSRQVMAQISLRRALKAQQELLEQAEQTSADLREALNLQEVLSLEIDHRVKNSLQQVTAFLRLQARAASNPEVREGLEEAEHRVMAIASIHAELHRSAAVDEVELSGYLVNLGRELATTADDAVTIDLTSDEILLPTGTATSLAVIVNEFVANSLKYAFPAGRHGTIAVHFALDGDQITAQFSDDGVGYSNKPEQPTRKGLGMRIMQAAAAQLDGEMSYDEDAKQGTRMRLSFPLKRKAPRA